MRRRLSGLATACVASSFCILFICCSSARPSSPAAPVPVGKTSTAMTDWKLTGRVDSKSRCERTEAPVEIHSQKVAYPDAVRQEGIAGTVVLQSTVTPDGTPTRIQVIRTSNSRLTSLAVDALRGSRFRAATCDGTPIDAYATTTFSFDLK